MLKASGHKLNHLARSHPRKALNFIRRPKPIYSSSFCCAHLKSPTRVQLPALHPTQREAYPGEGNILLDKLGRPLQKTRRSNRYGVCHKCGDLLINLSRHPSRCDRIPPHSDGLGGESSARNLATPSTPAAESSNQSEQSSQSRHLPWGSEDVGPMLDAINGTTLARISLSTA